MFSTSADNLRALAAFDTFSPGFSPPAAVFPVTITFRIDRDIELVDEALRNDPAMRTAASDLTRNLTRTRGSIDEAVSLQAFALRFRQAFPGLRLATAAHSPREEMRTRPLTAVSLPGQISYGIGQIPYFFAPRPLLNRLWSSDPAFPVSIPTYANGVITGHTDADLAGVDLDTWGRKILAAVDRFLSPEFGIAACDSLAIPEHSTLRGLAQQFEAPLNTFGVFVAEIPYLLQPGFTVRTSGGRAHEITLDDTLRSVAAAVGISIETLVDLYATDTHLLHAGADLGLVTQHRRARADDTFGTLIDTLARGAVLSDAIEIFLAMNGDSPRLLAPDAELTLAIYVVLPGDTLDSIPNHLGTTGTQLGELNAERPDLLLAGVRIQLEGDDQYTIREGDSLARVAVRRASPWR